MRVSGCSKRAIAVSMVLVFSGLGAYGDDRGNQVARMVDATESVVSARMVMTMAIRQTNAAEPRLFSVVSYENDTGDTLVEFLDPRSVRGMRILSRGNGNWVFFPSTGRVRKIGGSSRSGSVSGVGGDFSYNDLGGGAWADDYDFSLVGEDPKNWILEGVRRSTDASYDAVRLVVDKNMNKFTLASFSLASEGGWFKELHCSDFNAFDGKLVASRMIMRNLKTSSSTEILVSEARFDQTLEDRLFDPARFHQ